MMLVKRIQSEIDRFKYVPFVRLFRLSILCLEETATHKAPLAQDSPLINALTGLLMLREVEVQEDFMFALLHSPFDVRQGFTPVTPALEVDRYPEEVFTPSPSKVLDQTKRKVVLLKVCYLLRVVMYTGEEDDRDEVRSFFFRPSCKEIRQETYT